MRPNHQRIGCPAPANRVVPSALVVTGGAIAWVVTRPAPFVPQVRAAAEAYPRGNVITLDWGQPGAEEGSTATLSVEGAAPPAGCPGTVRAPGRCSFTGTHETLAKLMVIAGLRPDQLHPDYFDTARAELLAAVAARRNACAPNTATTPLHGLEAALAALEILGEPARKTARPSTCTWHWKAAREHWIEHLRARNSTCYSELWRKIWLRLRAVQTRRQCARALTWCVQFGRQPPRA